MKHLFRNIFSLVFAIALCLSSSSFVFTAEAENSIAIEEHEVVSKVEEAIKLFYENKDLGYSNDLGKILDKPILLLLGNKANIQQYVSTLYKTSKENYSVEIILLENTKVDNQAHMKFQVITAFNYQNSHDVDTEVSEEVYVLYNYEKALITDFYTANNYYDMAVREQGSDTLLSPLISLTPDIESKQQRLRNDIDRVYASQMLDGPANNNNNSLLRSSLNRSAIVSYARNNYSKQSPASGNGTVPYYDFSQISGNYDCTNFVSHALLAGGANVYDTGGSGISSTGWYYRNLSNRSSSWSGVNELYKYLVNNTVSNYPSGISSMYSHHTGAWDTGYVMQFGNSSSSFSHSTIITKKDYSSDGDRAYALVTGRTSATQNNNNQAADDMFPNGYKRTIYVYNY